MAPFLTQKIVSYISIPPKKVLINLHTHHLPLSMQGYRIFCLHEIMKKLAAC